MEKFILILLFFTTIFVKAQIDYNSFIFKNEPDLTLVKEISSYIIDTINNINKVIEVKEYDNYGRIKKRFFYKNLNINREYVYLYENSLLHIIKETFIDSNENRINVSNEVYFYNSNKDLTLKLDVYFFENKNDTIKTIYTYTKNKKIEKNFATSDSIFHLKYTKINKYDDNGRVLSYNYISNEKSFDKRLYIYENGQLTQILNYTNDKLDLKENYKYNKNELVSAFFTYKDSDSPSLKTIYNYEKGLLINVKTYLHDSIFTEEKYNYDSKRFLISKTNISYDDNGKMDDFNCLYYHILYR